MVGRQGVTIALERVVNSILRIASVVARVDEGELDGVTVHAGRLAVDTWEVRHPGNAALERASDGRRALGRSVVLVQEYGRAAGGAVIDELGERWLTIS